MLGARLKELLNIDYPIIQGAMAWIADARLAAAVSNAGGLGIIASATMNRDQLDAEITKIRSLTNKPWGINIYYLSEHLDDVIDLVVDRKIPVVTTGAGNPGKHISALKNAGTKVIPVVSSVALAKRLERVGVDAIIAEGMEGGGHIGDLTTMSLVPQIADAVKIPVIAAGGVVEGRTLLAAFVLGAEGVQIGTRFLCSNECPIHENYKNAIIKASDRSTVITGARYGHPVRILQNKLAKSILRLEDAGAAIEDVQHVTVGTLKLAVESGDVENGSLMAGQSSAMVTKIQPVSEIVQEMYNEANEAYVRLKDAMEG
jgi:enoyl-[acyl-carrier protein] reductase II